MSVRAKKHLGQHFLNDQKIAFQIVDSLSWNGYEHVLEIGPGMGVLTHFLIEEKKQISVVEIDQESVEYLNEKYNTINSVLPIYSEDFLKMNLNSIVKEPTAILGNFPYNISSQILFKVLENKEMIPEVVGMFQKEVAERVAAKHGNKVYGILSVLVQAFYHTEYLFTVNENVFTPPPQVKSGVIRLTKFRNEIEGVDTKYFFAVVKVGFGLRRKTLRNALKALPNSQNFPEHKFANLRAEQLSVDDFVELTQILS